MAYISSSAAVSVVLSVMICLASPACSMKCQSQKFKNRDYQNCEDLPQLKAFLHYTYDKPNNSLSFAFTAPPPNPDGWVSWGINPTKEGMVGTQAIMGVKDEGVVKVKTFDLGGYAGIKEGKLSIDAWDLAAEEGHGVISVFGKLALPGKGTTVNHVWQVGPGVMPGIGAPRKHDMEEENLTSKGKLVLKAGKNDDDDSASSPASTPGSAPVPAPASTPVSAPKASPEKEGEKKTPVIEIKLPPSPPKAESGGAGRLSNVVGVHVLSSVLLAGNLFLF